MVAEARLLDGEHSQLTTMEALEPVEMPAPHDWCKAWSVSGAAKTEACQNSGLFSHCFPFRGTSNVGHLPR